MKLLLYYLSRQKKIVFFALLLAFIDQLFINLNPYIFGNYIIDPYASKVEYYRDNGLKQDFFFGIGGGILRIMLVSTIAWLAATYKDYFVNIVIRKLGTDLYTDVQRHTLNLPFQEFENYRSGEILSMLQRARTDCENFINKFMSVLFTSIVSISVVIVIAFILSPALPFVYLTGALLLLFITNFLSRKMTAIQSDILKETNALAGSTTESFRNVELIKSLGLVSQEISRLESANESILKRELRKLKNVRSISSSYGAFIQFFHQAIIFFLLFFLFNDKLTLGQLMMMQLYFYSMFGLLGEMGGVIVAYRDVQASLNNLDTILKKDPEKYPTSPQKVGILNAFRFEEVSFKHQSSSFTLNNISFEAKVGQTVAIVGPSGSGKSTILKLLIGLYGPTSGKILYNEVRQQDADLTEIRHQIGLVPQDAQLFSGTIKENLLFVNPFATDEMILEVLEMASCNGLLERSKEGINTFIGEGGIKLSGGEKQRLAIARSLLRDSRLLIFDEATSSLDSLTEKGISDTIRKIARQKRFITILIAHRLSTVMFADTILVLDKGEFVEKGMHFDLLKSNGLYSSMWLEQVGKNEPNSVFK